MIHERGEGRRDRVKQEWCKKWKWDVKEGEGGDVCEGNECNRAGGWRDERWRKEEVDEEEKSSGAALWRDRGKQRVQDVALGSGK